MSEFRAAAQSVAWRLWAQAAVGIGCVGAGLAAMDFSPVWLVLIALPALVLSVNLGFDAWLFERMARHDDEMAACRDVDEVLARARLKPMPETTRDLAARIAGTRRLAYAQALATGLFAVVVVLWMLQA